LEVFVRITKEVCHFPSFFNGPLYQRIVDLWNKERPDESDQTDAVSFQSLEWFWKKEMEPFDPPERFFRLVKQPEQDCILRDDFLPYIKALLNDHPVCTDGDV
jgi:serine/threonine-protein phosphatase 2A regulatory subunit B''